MYGEWVKDGVHVHIVCFVDTWGHLGTPCPSMHRAHTCTWFRYGSSIRLLQVKQDIRQNKHPYAQENKWGLAGRSKAQALLALSPELVWLQGGCWHCPLAPVLWHGEDYSPAGVWGRISAVPAPCAKSDGVRRPQQTQAYVQNGSSSLDALFRMKGAVPRESALPPSVGTQEGALYPKE